MELAQLSIHDGIETKDVVSNLVPQYSHQGLKTTVGGEGFVQDLRGLRKGGGKRVVAYYVRKLWYQGWKEKVSLQH